MKDINSSQMKVYAKNTFDRFGDDLTELIVSYLWFEDKVRLECVSKQWRRLVFNKQFELEIFQNNVGTNYSLRLHRKVDRRLTINRTAFESVLKKCPNIERVYIDFKVESEVLSLIGRYCHRITSLGYCQRSGFDENVLSFFRMYGHKLEELYLSKGNDKVNEILQSCPNVKRISKYYFKKDREFLPKLEQIKSTILIFPKTMNKMKILSDKYSQTMKTLHLRLLDLTYEELKTCIEYIARFENLKVLTLYLDYLNTTQPIDDCLSLIGQKCNKLLKLDLSIDFRVEITDRFFHTFHEFKAIKKLKIKISPKRVVNGSVECFKHCKQLIELDINYPELSEDFFANIASFVPKLKLFGIKTRNQFSDSFIGYFHSIENIEKVNHRFIGKNNKNWYFGKSVSEVMLSPNGMNVKHITHNCGLII